MLVIFTVFLIGILMGSIVGSTDSDFGAIAVVISFAGLLVCAGTWMVQ